MRSRDIRVHPCTESGIHFLPLRYREEFPAFAGMTFFAGMTLLAGMAMVAWMTASGSRFDEFQCPAVGITGNRFAANFITQFIISSVMKI